MIKKAKINQLRGKSFELELDLINLVIGSNAAGKTTIADGIKWGLLGYIPSMAAPPRGWSDLLATGHEWASVELETAISAHKRTLTLEKGAVKMGTGQFGAIPVNVLSLDPEKFFAATGPQKAQLVAEASATDFDWRALVPDELRDEELDQVLAWPVWLNGAIEQAKAGRAAQADAKKMLAQTLRGLESIREVVVEDDQSIKADRDAVLQQIGVLKDAHRAVTQQLQNVQQTQLSSKTQDRLDAVRRELSQHVGENHDGDTIDDRMTVAKVDVDQFRAAKLNLPSAEDMAQLRTSLSEAGQTVAVLNAAIERYEETEVESITAKYAKLRKAKCCPTCGTAGTGFTAAVKRLEKTELDQNAAKLKKAQAEWSEAQIAHERLGKRVAEAESNLARKAELDGVLAQLQAEAYLIGLWREHDELVAKQQAEQVYDAQGLEERRYDLACDIEELGERLADLEKELAAIVYKRGQKKQLAEIEEQLEKAEAEWTRNDGAVKQLEVLRKQWTAMSLDPILKRMAALTKGIFADPLSLDGVELGRIVGTRWVPLEQFSGAEQAVAMAALTCALQGATGQDNIVLADELSAFDDEHLLQFLANVNEAINAKIIHQFIGFSTPRTEPGFSKKFGKLCGRILTI